MKLTVLVDSDGKPCGFTTRPTVTLFCDIILVDALNDCGIQILKL